MTPLREWGCYGRPPHPTPLWALCTGEQKVQALHPSFMTKMLLQTYREEPTSSSSCSCMEGRPGGRHSHKEGMSQRKHREAQDSSEQAKDLDNLESQDLSDWLVKSSASIPGKWADSLTTYNPHRACWVG